MQYFLNTFETQFIFNEYIYCALLLSDLTNAIVNFTRGKLATKSYFILRGKITLLFSSQTDLNHRTLLFLRFKYNVMLLLLKENGFQLHSMLPRTELQDNNFVVSMN